MALNVKKVGVCLEPETFAKLEELRVIYGGIKPVGPSAAVAHAIETAYAIAEKAKKKPRKGEPE